MKTLVTLVLLGGVALAKVPEKPTIPADKGPIRTGAAECLKDAEEATGLSIADGGDAQTLKDWGTELCKLRVQHAAARERLLGGLARLVAELKGATNHDHAQRLPETIAAIQGVVADCVKALSSQQYCHNIGCAEEPESNLILCEGKAAEILETIIPR